LIFPAIAKTFWTGWNKERMMAETDVTLSRHDLEAKIIKHSWDDLGFRKQFIADPKGTVAKYAGTSAADLPEIVVHEEAPGSWHIVLPAKPSAAQELSDEDLERVAGGTTPTITPTAVSLSAILSATQKVSQDEGGW
jgi:hypothetical protein